MSSGGIPPDREQMRYARGWGEGTGMLMGMGLPFRVSKILELKQC
jgi:hypothetical protein